MSACRSSALAQNGSYLGEESSSPSTFPPMVAPFQSQFYGSVQLPDCQVGKLQSHRKFSQDLRSDPDKLRTFPPACDSVESIRRVARSRSAAYQNGTMLTRLYVYAHFIHLLQALSTPAEGPSMLRLEAPARGVPSSKPAASGTTM